MKSFVRWIPFLLLVAFAGFGATLLVAQGTQQLLFDSANPITDTNELAPATESSVDTATAPKAMDAQIEPVALARIGIAAVGIVELANEVQVVFGVAGQVDSIPVEVGDQVKQGDLIASLDTTYLDWDVEQAEIGLETARINFQELGEQIEESDIAVAEAALEMAQEQLTETLEGPTAEQLAAARSSSASAWAHYNELLEQPTEAQTAQAQSNLTKAQISVQAAQREFDKIAWLPEAAASAAADDLQSATIDYETAQVVFDEANKPATPAELQSALSAANKADDALNQLLKQPTPASVAEVQARVAAAQAALDQLNKGPKESELGRSELAVRQAMISLQQARLQRSMAEAVSPVDGTVFAINVDPAQRISAGTVAAMVADPLDIRLLVNVEQKDVSNIVPGQSVQISVFALPDEPYTGVVERIGPSTASETGFVTFPVRVGVTDGAIERLLPGMTASAVFGEPAAEQDTEVQESEAEPEEEESEAEEPEATSTPSS